MLGEAKSAGLVAMSLEHLFHLIGQNSDRYFLLKLSMLEIYNEVINDLLEPGSTNLVLREDSSKGQVMVAGVKNVEVSTAPRTQPLLLSLLHIDNCTPKMPIYTSDGTSVFIFMTSVAATAAGTFSRACTVSSGHR
jgi:Kinesin motor domain